MIERMKCMFEVEYFKLFEVRLYLTRLVAFQNIFEIYLNNKILNFIRIRNYIMKYFYPNIVYIVFEYLQSF